ncbi:hypothetical protein FHT91_003621 [Rhizobium sp. BK347]|jgi:hypothetical protein|nr:hypothetical protein [Rhizobium sp. BK252]MBB3403382.1 hypothetical protein [Rhizobium sp. BK289]MBB3415957.1 hypothetical protein [Rhizobium sp. BK284]MBB3483845.1 hypothetical protein [Rhizobium sp. BK347]
MENAERLRGALSLFVLVEMGIEIAMSFEHIHNLENIIDIAEEDHISAKCKATHVVSQLRPQAAHVTWQSGEICALAA